MCGGYTVAKKIKRVKPELHPLDKTIYALLIIFSFAAAFALIFNCDRQTINLCLADESVAAYWTNGGKTMLALAVFLVVGVTTYAGLSLAGRLPLLKPLQLEGRTRAYTPELRRRVKKHNIISVVMLLLFLVFVLIAFIPDVSRRTMDAEGTVTIYSAKNEVKETYKIRPDDASLVEFKTNPGGRHIETDAYMDITCKNGDTYHVHMNEFKDKEFAIEFFENFKAQLGGNVMITYDAEYMEVVVNYFGLTSSQITRMNDLYNVNG